MSGVTVAQIMRSTSNGDVFVFSSKILIALAAISEVALLSSFKILLSFIPVLVVIHSSDVSTILESSLFVRTYSGTQPATPEILAFVNM